MFTFATTDITLALDKVNFICFSTCFSYLYILKLFALNHFFMFAP